MIPRASRRLWAVSALLLGLGGVVSITLAAAADHDKITDRTFIRLANARCARAERDDIAPNRVGKKGQDEVRRIEALAGGWESMVRDLRTLPVAASDVPRVRAWLDAWDRWTELGRQYARALSDEDDQGAADVASRSEVPKAQINHFALANDMPDCVFR